MKKVLWICNIMLPAIAKELHLPYSVREGWLSGIFDRMTLENDRNGIELSVCFPVGTEEKEKDVNHLTVRGVQCYGFYENLNTPEIYDCNLEEAFREIFKKAEPDIIHIFGTEFPHAPAAAKAFGKPERTLIGIQGLCSEIARVYMAGLPQEVTSKVTFRDFIRKDSLKQQQQKFYARGENEIKAIGLAGHITGRTGFDREKTAKLNPGAHYYHMNETMRGSFYEGKWNLESCRRHSIFLGQGDYPLKGFHFLLQAMPLILQKYPDTVLYVAGNNITAHDTWKEKLKLPAYGKYLLTLIRQHRLTDKVILTGRLTEEEMKQQFLKSHVFVCASVLENSPNTVGEAMLLGVPVAVSRTGGIPDMVTDREEGLLFECGSPEAIAEAVMAVFDEKPADGVGTLAEKISEKARERARNTHNRENNYKRLLEIYGSIWGA